MIRISSMVVLAGLLGAGCDADFLPEKTGCTQAGGACDGDRDCVPFSCTCSSASKSGTISKCSSGKCSTNPCTSLCGSTKGAVLSSSQQPVPARCTGSTPGGSCGDGRCDPKSETCSSCEHDCGKCSGTCGDGRCDPGETCTSCSMDCPCTARDLGADRNQPVCGNGLCEMPVESAKSCPKDCL